jgi:hypothetical protein
MLGGHRAQCLDNSRRDRVSENDKAIEVMQVLIAAAREHIVGASGRLRVAIGCSIG